MYQLLEGIESIVFRELITLHCKADVIGGLSAMIDLERHDAIRRRLRALGVNFTDIANSVGCVPSLVTMVCQGHRSNVAIETEIAARLNDVPSNLWPHRYEEETK